MEHEIVNKETPEMKELISGIKEVSKRIREIAQTHRPLFGGEMQVFLWGVVEKIYLRNQAYCAHIFLVKKRRYVFILYARSLGNF